MALIATTHCAARPGIPWAVLYSIIGVIAATVAQCAATGVLSPDQYVSVNDGLELLAAIQQGTPHIVLQNHINFTDVAPNGRDEPRLRLKPSTKTIQGACFEAPTTGVIPQPSSGLRPGQCVIEAYDDLFEMRGTAQNGVISTRTNIHILSNLYLLRQDSQHPSSSNGTGFGFVTMIEVNTATLMLLNVTLDGGAGSSSRGRGLHSLSGITYAEDCEFANFEADQGSAWLAVPNDPLTAVFGAATLFRCDFRNNAADTAGPALFAREHYTASLLNTFAPVDTNTLLGNDALVNADQDDGGITVPGLTESPAPAPAPAAAEADAPTSAGGPAEAPDSERTGLGGFILNFFSRRLSAYATGCADGTDAECMPAMHSSRSLQQVVDRRPPGAPPGAAATDSGQEEPDQAALAMFVEPALSSNDFFSRSRIYSDNGMAVQLYGFPERRVVASSAFNTSDPEVREWLEMPGVVPPPRKNDERFAGKLLEMQAALEAVVSEGQQRRPRSRSTLSKAAIAGIVAAGALSVAAVLFLVWRNGLCTAGDQRKEKTAPVDTKNESEEWSGLKKLRQWTAPIRARSPRPSSDSPPNPPDPPGFVNPWLDGGGDSGLIPRRALPPETVTAPIRAADGTAATSEASKLEGSNAAVSSCATPETWEAFGSTSREFLIPVKGKDGSAAVQGSSGCPAGAFSGSACGVMQRSVKSSESARPLALDSVAASSSRGPRTPSGEGSAAFAEASAESSMKEASGEEPFVPFVDASAVGGGAGGGATPGEGGPGELAGVATRVVATRGSEMVGLREVVQTRPWSRGTWTKQSKDAHSGATTQDAQLSELWISTNVSIHTFVDVTKNPNNAAKEAEVLAHTLDVLAARGTTFLGKFLIEDSGSRFRGGQGLVQFAKDINSNEECAIKFFTHRGAFERERELYENEDEALRAMMAAVKHLEANGDGSHMMTPERPFPPCIVVEKGESLDTWATHVRPSFIAIWQVLADLMQLLAAMHAAGIVHRDLKPPNVLWRPRVHEWTLIDFGCAAAIDSEAPLMLSLAYAPPEVVNAYAAAQPTVRVSAAQDIWALGVMAFELLTRTAVFPAFTPRTDILRAAAGEVPLPWEGDGPSPTGDGPSPSELRTRLGRLESSILRCLARDPAARPCAVDILREWDTWLNETHDLFTIPKTSSGLSSGQMGSFGEGISPMAPGQAGLVAASPAEVRECSAAGPFAGAIPSPPGGGVHLAKTSRGFSLGGLELPLLSSGTSATAVLGTPITGAQPQPSLGRSADGPKPPPLLPRSPQHTITSTNAIEESVPGNCAADPANSAGALPQPQQPGASAVATVGTSISTINPHPGPPCSPQQTVTSAIATDGAMAGDCAADGHEPVRAATSGDASTAGASRGAPRCSARSVEDARELGACIGNLGHPDEVAVSSHEQEQASLREAGPCTAHAEEVTVRLESGGESGVGVQISVSNVSGSGPAVCETPLRENSASIAGTGVAKSASLTGTGGGEVL